MPGSRSECAQRLSASRSFAAPITRPMTVCAESAQRLSASRSFADWQRLPPLAGIPVCSTPFGITEFRGTQRYLEIIRGRECSTPFGITEFRGWLRNAAIQGWQSAQRLSASRSFAARRHQGILRPLRVLNAFRHHGVSRFYIAVLQGAGSGVLNAFRHHGVSRGWKTSSKIRGSGAERLSASRRFAGVVE